MTGSGSSTVQDSLSHRLQEWGGGSYCILLTSALQSHSLHLVRILGDACSPTTTRFRIDCIVFSCLLENLQGEGLLLSHMLQCDARAR